MENPNTWGPVEKTIAKAITDADKAFANGVMGKSIVRYISDALREAGYLKED